MAHYVVPIYVTIEATDDKQAEVSRKSVERLMMLGGMIPGLLASSGVKHLGHVVGAPIPAPPKGARR